MIEKTKMILIRLFNKINYSISYMNSFQIPEEPCIFVFNHGTANDGPIVKEVVSKLRNDLYKKTNGNTKKIYSKMLSGSDCLNTFQKILFVLMNWIPIDRTNNDEKKKSIDKMVQAHNDNWDLIIFPEATWNVSSELVKPFHKGVGMVAHMTGCKVVPCAIFRKHKDEYVISCGKVIDSHNYISEWSETIYFKLNSILTKSYSINKVVLEVKKLADDRKIPFFVAEHIIQMINEKFNTYQKDMLMLECDIREYIYGITLSNRIKQYIDLILKDKYLLNTIENVLNGLSEKNNKITQKEIYEFILKSNYNVSDIIEQNFQTYFLNLKCTNEIKIGFIEALFKKKTLGELQSQLLDYLEPLELTQAIENRVASLYGEMLFSQQPELNVNSRNYSNEQLKAELLKKENGFQLNYDNESKQFHRKKKSYYSNILMETKEYIYKDEIPIWDYWDYMEKQSNIFQKKLKK